MATTNLSNYDPTTVPSGEGKRFAIVVSEWNDQVTNSLASGAIETLKEYGVAEEDIVVDYVPGSFELIYGCHHQLDSYSFDAVIAIGCIVRGETPHFDYLSESVSINLGALNTHGSDTPVIFGVLTTDDMQQALDRAGGKHGNKGVEAAVTALKLVGRLPRRELPF